MYSMRKYCVDLEADGLYNKVNKIHCIVAIDIDTKEIIKAVTEEEQKQLLAKLSVADQIIGHNFIDYDLRVIDKIYKVKLNVDKVVDTMLLSYMLYPHLTKHRDCPASKETTNGRKIIGCHGLENWGYHLSKGKVEYEDWETYTPQMLERCVVDTQITELLYNKFVG